jgi:hypothetical protein
MKTKQIQSEKAYTRVRTNLFTKPYRLWLIRDYYEEDFFDDGDGNGELF